MLLCCYYAAITVRWDSLYMYQIFCELKYKRFLKKSFEYIDILYLPLNMSNIIFLVVITSSNYVNNMLHLLLRISLVLI